MKKIILYVLLFPILVNCSAINEATHDLVTPCPRTLQNNGKCNYVYEKLTDTEVLPADKTIVILRAYSEFPYFGTRKQVRGPLFWARLDNRYTAPDKYTVLLKPERHYDPAEKQGEAYAQMIAPGTYVLDVIDFQILLTLVRSSVPGFNPENGKVAFGSFKALPGEVVYIGDFEIQASEKDKVDFEIHDNYEEAVQVFRKNYPLLSKNRTINKRLIRLKGTLPLELLNKNSPK